MALFLKIKKMNKCLILDNLLRPPVTFARQDSAIVNSAAMKVQ